MTSPKNRAKDGPIKSPALNITLFSGATLSIGALITRWQGLFEQLFGYQPEDNPGAAAAIFASLVVAIGLIVAGDLLARGLASSRVGDTAVIPTGLTATLVKAGADEAGYAVVGARATGAGTEFLVVKQGEAPTWRRAGDQTGNVKLQGSS